MPLPSFLKSKEKKPAERRKPAGAAADDSGPVQEARTRARQRLIGAVVLLAAGVIGFPILFETQPRPVAVDIPIETPQRNRGVVTEAPAPAPRSLPPVEPPTEPVPGPSRAPSSAAAPAPGPAPAAPVATAPAAAPTASGPAPAAAVASAPAPVVPVAPVAPASALKPESGARARALLEGGAASAPAVARFVVQVGAFSDANALREVRAKVEKLGLKTYTQAVETDAGPRTRVRVGPFATRDEAEKVAARLKGGGLPAAILAL